jgi:heterodisulfide reductase subunit C
MESVDPEFIHKIQKLGAFDVTACYSCGNCTAICPLSEGRYSFPRKMIRYTLLGLKDKIRRSPDLWLCYYCGECSDTCPREADPGALMMALRRYSIAKTSLGGIAGLFYNKVSSLILWLLLTVFAGWGLYLIHNPEPNLKKAVPLSFIGLDVIHKAGIVIGIFILAFVLAQIVLLAKSLQRKGEKAGLTVWSRSFFKTLFREIVLQNKFLKCEAKSRYIAHLALFWGFMGLLLATVLVFGVDFYGFPEFLRVVAKIDGILFGCVFLYGCLFYILKRSASKDTYSKYSHQSDWIFLILMFLAGLTGFILDIFKWFNLPWPTYIAFAVHLVVVFDLLITFPFTKFAHAIYRPFAIWIAETRNLAGKAAQ